MTGLRLTNPLTLRLRPRWRDLPRLANLLAVQFGPQDAPDKWWRRLPAAAAFTIFLLAFRLTGDVAGKPEAVAIVRRHTVFAALLRGAAVLVVIGAVALAVMKPLLGLGVDAAFGLFPRRVAIIASWGSSPGSWWIKEVSPRDPLGQR